MVYQIYYTPKNAPKGNRGYCMFDIEYYLKVAYPRDMKVMFWQSELHCLPCVEGLSYFVRDKSDENFDVGQFVKDATEIQELRGLLWEWNNNKPKPKEEAEEFHYHKFGKELKEKIDKFCEKYDLWLNID